MGKKCNLKPYSRFRVKFKKAKEISLANYSFIGASNDNLEDVLKTDPKNVTSYKNVMGSTTGNMLVDDKDILEKIARNRKC